MSCNRGELEEAQCLRKVAGHFGLCPVADVWPQLLPEHDQAVDIFNEATNTSRHFDTEKKLEIAIEVSDFTKLCDIHGVIEEDREELWEKVRLLQDVWNDVQPERKSRGTSSGTRKPRRR